MTVQELCAIEGVNLCYFDGKEWHSQGFYNPVLNVLALDIRLSDDDQKKVALHELGHREHLPCITMRIGRNVSFKQTET